MCFYTKEAIFPVLMCKVELSTYLNREKYFTNQAKDFTLGKCKKLNMFENIGWQISLKTRKLC